MKTVGTIILCYLIGSYPTAYLIGLLVSKKDIRRIGTKNMGALNAFRSLGPFFGILTFFIDAAKGFLPIFFILRQTDNIVLIGFCVISLLCGHNWSLFIGFHGGKGGSTSSGIILALFPQVFLLSFFIFIFLSVLTSNVSFGLGISFLFLPFLVSFSTYPKSYFYLSLLIPIIGLIRTFPLFLKMIVESKGNFSKMLFIVIHGFTDFNKSGDK